MRIIFGLGNPGSDYTGTRHNIGFMAVNKLAKEQNITFSEKEKFKAYIAEVSVTGEKVLLVKPTTFYNNVGESARALIDFYKLTPSEDFLTIHDDLALPFGTIRVRRKGSDAGNNGIKSLNAHIGADYARLRVGIATDERTSDETAFVLGRFNSDQLTALKETIIPKIDALVQEFLEGTLADTSHRI